MVIKNSIIIAGKICSGKSTLAKQISFKTGFPIASFGQYLLSYSKEKSLPTNREALQNLGTKLIEENYVLFLQNVVQSIPKDKDKLIFEGVRHNSIFHAINGISNNSVSIFLDVNLQERLRRFINREKEIDLESNENLFFERDNHIVEKEINEIKKYCDFVLDNSANDQELNQILRQYDLIKNC